MKIGFVGFGNMAQALAAGFIRAGALKPNEIGACAQDCEKLRRNTEHSGFHAFASAAEMAAFADLVVVAVKPHQVDAVLAPLKEALVGKVVVSVVAGYSFEKYEHILKTGTHHISTIPNTPVSVCEGVVVYEHLHSLTGEEFRQFEALFSSVGLLVPIATEQLGVAGTVTGCGPAFVFMFIEALADAAVKHGIARADAYRMASRMVSGAGKLQLETGLHPALLKDAVCSPAGTTIVGVAELERKGLRGAVIDAIDAIQQKR